MGTSGPVTNSLATAYSNQKKLVTLSTGRMVAVVGNTTTNAQFLWSDDGQTWTDYSADILGWANGSIAAYVDSGGVERLVATWKQSGTGGVRTDQYIYTMVGTFNVGRTTITWGTALVVYANTVANFPDLVVTQEGTGGHVCGVLSIVSGAANYTRYDTQLVDSSGVITIQTNTTDLGSSTGYGVHTYPSIDINPITKDLYVAWSNGSTGVGQGIRFKKATYSAGTWTWGSEVEVDNTRYVDLTNRWIVCRWDGTRVVLSGVLSNNSSLDLIIYETTNFATFVTRTLATGSSIAPFRGSSAINGATGDIFLFGGASGGTNDLVYYKWTRATTTLGPQVVTDSGVMSTPFINAIYSGGKIRWIYTAGNNSPYQVKYDELSTLVLSGFIGWGVPM